MFEAERVMFLYAEEPLHPGAEAGWSDVDLPIQREAASGFLTTASSALRRSLREPLQPVGGAPGWQAEERVIFGSTLDRQDGFGDGILSVTDMRIVLLPVRGLTEALVWVTSPLAIARLDRSVRSIGHTLPDIRAVGSDKDILLGESSALGRAGQRIVLEDYLFTAASAPEVDDLAVWLRDHAFPRLATYAPWRIRLVADGGIINDKPPGHSRLAVVTDEVFRDLCETACPVSTHIRIDVETGTVDPGALWTQEDVPQETLFYSRLLAASPRDADELPKGLAGKGRPSADTVLEFLRERLPDDGLLQLGGDQASGRGFLRARWLLPPKKEPIPPTSAVLEESAT
jgi:CRISPR-associated protein Cmr4